MKKFIVIGSVSVVPEEVKQFEEKFDEEMVTDTIKKVKKFLKVLFYDDRLPIRAENISIEEVTEIMNEHFEEMQKSRNKLKVKMQSDIDDIFKVMGLPSFEFPTVVKVKAGEELKPGDVVKKVTTEAKFKVGDSFKHKEVDVVHKIVKIENECYYTDDLGHHFVFSQNDELELVEDELEIDVENGKITLPDGRVLAITETLKVRCGLTSGLVMFKTDAGYIEDPSVITEIWDETGDGQKRYYHKDDLPF